MQLPAFLNPGDDTPEAVVDHPRVAILPLPYEGTVSWHGGTAEGPRALLEASAQVETWDEMLECEPCRVGIVTHPAPTMPEGAEQAVEVARTETAALLDKDLYPVAIGGEHSLSYGVYRALAERYDDLGVVQFDAHADLRDSYEGTPFSHASVMARIREHTDRVVQLGIRALSGEEARRVRQCDWSVGYMHDIRSGMFDVESAIDRLPQNIFITFDVDAMDLSVIRSTGTPDPGGFSWAEAMEMLEMIYRRKTVVGFDVMELAAGDAASAYAAARLVYRLIGFRFRDELPPCRAESNWKSR